MRYKEKRGITAEEHRTAAAAEPNPERKAFFELVWHLGAAQGDLATLGADNIDWENKFISLRRKKTGTVAVLRFGEEVKASSAIRGVREEECRRETERPTTSKACDGRRGGLQPQKQRYPSRIIEYGVS